jgi:hypothetical protein
MTLAVAACVLITAALAYVGAYCRMVEPLALELDFVSGRDVIVPVYSWDDRANNFSSVATSSWDPFFEPIHRLDRHVRPAVWEPAP